MSIEVDQLIYSTREEMDLVFLTREGASEAGQIKKVCSK
jgi:hypothetical protein